MLASGRLETDERQKIKSQSGTHSDTLSQKKNRYKQTKYLWKYLILIEDYGENGSFKMRGNINEVPR